MKDTKQSYGVNSNDTLHDSAHPLLVIKSVISCFITAGHETPLYWFLMAQRVIKKLISTKQT